VEIRSFFVGDADDFQSKHLILLLKAIQVADGLNTVGAPGPPKIDQDQTAPVLAVLPRLAVQVIQAKVVQLFAHESTGGNRRAGPAPLRTARRRALAPRSGRSRQRTARSDRAPVPAASAARPARLARQAAREWTASPGPR